MNESPAATSIDPGADAAAPAGAAGLPPGPRSAKKAWLITSSYTLSLAIFAWSVALSMRSTAEIPRPTPPEIERSPAAEVAPPAATRSGAAHQVHRQRAHDDAYRSEALALDREFMQRQKRRMSSPRPAPSHQQAVARWQAQVERLRHRLRGHPNPEKHSVLWGQKQQLEALLADPPNAPSPAP